MNLKREFRAQVDDQGHLVLPPEIVSRYGLRPGAQVCIDERLNGLHLRQPATQLAKVYIEPTNRCNLECRTCIRNVWDEPLGQMSGKTFTRIIEGLRVFSPAPTIFFGGFGEPLAHPDIVEMVAQAKALRGPVELITNGTLLTKEMSRQLIEAGLDMLWVSLDGATPESYADVRLGAALPEVLANLDGFHKARFGPQFPPLFFDNDMKPRIGIVFVAMKRNIGDLPSVLRLGSQLGAVRFLVSNVLPYAAAMREEALYYRALTDIVYLPWEPHLKLPKMDISQVTYEPLYWVMRRSQSISLAGANLSDGNDRCPFVESGAAAISWEGNLSPCLPLLHSHRSFVDERERFSRRYVVGNLNEQNLHDLWNLSEYANFRQRVQGFDFSPCTFCGGCHLFETNEEDCFGNTFPTCGGCLWAQGVIQCP